MFKIILIYELRESCKFSLGVRYVQISATVPKIEPFFQPREVLPGVPCYPSSLLSLHTAVGLWSPGGGGSEYPFRDV